MSGAELHAHTTASDGILSPQEVVDVALQRHLEALAITDHDTLAGVTEAELQAEGRGLEIIPGVEISCAREKVSVHLLAYWPDLTVGALADELGKIRQSRRSRAAKMVKRLQEMGYSLTLDQVMELASGNNPGRPHVARALVATGAISHPDEAFTSELIGDGGRAYVEKYALDPVEAVEMVLESKGAPVLAHPGVGRGGEGVDSALIEEMADAGLIGLEAGHIDHTPSRKAHFEEMARRLGLLATAGSDCHGVPLKLGTRSTPLQTVQALKERAQTQGNDN